MQCYLRIKGGIPIKNLNGILFKDGSANLNLKLRESVFKIKVLFDFRRVTSTLE